MNQLKRSQSSHIKKIRITVNDNTRYRPSCSFAEFNKVRLSSKKQIQDTNQPIRITIPNFFNVPQHQDASAALIRSRQLKGEIMKELYITDPNQQIVLPISIAKRIKDVKTIMKAMKRVNNIKQQGRCHYSLGVLYENVHDYVQSIQNYEHFLNITLSLQDRRSVELVLNSIGIVYMRLKDYNSAIEYHSKQAELSQSQDKYIGYINAGLCYLKINKFQQAFKQYKTAYYYNKSTLVKDFILSIQQNLKEEDSDFRNSIDTYLQGIEEEQPDIKTYIRLAELSAKRKDYSKSRVGFAKAIQMGFLKDSPKTTELIKKAKVGFAITSAENSMKVYLETYTKNLAKYKLR